MNGFRPARVVIFVFGLSGCAGLSTFAALLPTYKAKQGFRRGSLFHVSYCMKESHTLCN